MKYKVDDTTKVESDDLRDLLKVGYKVVNGNGLEIYLETNDDVLYLKATRNNDLNYKYGIAYNDIIEIYRPKYNGVKPMEWELVWERKEPKYYLRSWVDSDGNVIDDIFESEDNYLNTFVKEKVWLFIADREEVRFHKTQFTLEEIDNLPNQEFIKTLVKEEVE